MEKKGRVVQYRILGDRSPQLHNCKKLDTRKNKFKVANLQLSIPCTYEFNLYYYDQLVH
jgi:hypothetical protein